jgi:hypothetical protein
VGLTPRALNDVPVVGVGPGLAENVYEWEADGSEVDGRVECHEAGGCVSLISDGSDASEGHGTGALSSASSVELKGVSTSGDDVFFTTADELVGQDTDTQLDFYDARVNGGFPRPTPEEQCEEGNLAEHCRGESSAPGVFGPLTSVSPVGSGNFTAGEVKPPVKPPVKPLTRAQKLTKALQACHKDRSKKKRAACERQARKRYAPPAKKKAKAKKAERGGRHA